MTPRTLWFTGTAAIILALDLVTKAWIVATLGYRDGYPVLEGFFNIVHARNTGAAFGLLADADRALVIPFFVIVGAAALIFLTILVRRLPPGSRLLAATLGSVAGGAVGNIIDRVRYGYVVDFLDVHIGRHHWPAFNVADIGITVGVSLLVLLSLLGRDEGLFEPGTSGEDAGETPS